MLIFKERNNLLSPNTVSVVNTIYHKHNTEHLELIKIISIHISETVSTNGQNIYGEQIGNTLFISTTFGYYFYIKILTSTKFEITSKNDINYFIDLSNPTSIQRFTDFITSHCCKESDNNKFI